MKVVLVSLLALASASAAQACPNLAGHFQCKDFENGSVQDIVTTQTALPGGVQDIKMVITSDGKAKTYEYVTNGQPRAIDNPKYSTMTETSTCEGAKLKTVVHGVVKEGGAVLNAIALTYLMPNGDMYDNYIGSEGGRALNYEEVCQRLP